MTPVLGVTLSQGCARRGRKTSGFVRSDRTAARSTDHTSPQASIIAETSLEVIAGHPLSASFSVSVQDS